MGVPRARERRSIKIALSEINGNTIWPQHQSSLAVAVRAIDLALYCLASAVSVSVIRVSYKLVGAIIAEHPDNGVGSEAPAIDERQMSSDPLLLVNCFLDLCNLSPNPRAESSS